MDDYCCGYSGYDDYDYDEYDNCYCRGECSRKDLLCVQVPNKRKTSKMKYYFGDMVLLST